MCVLRGMCFACGGIAITSFSKLLGFSDTDEVNHMMHPKDTGRMANSEDPDQIASGAA